MKRLHLIKPNIDLMYDDSNKISKSKGINISQVREVKVLTENSQFIMIFDERFNEIDFIYNDNPDDPFKYSNKVANYLLDKYKELKESDFRYKRGDGYENSKNILLDDFIKHLKIENRNIVIESIL